MRSFNRLETDQSVQCVVDDLSFEAQLYNLSCGGCMLELGDVEISEGAVIEVTLKTGTTLPGKIVWRVDQNTGIKFDHHLHQKVVEACGQFDAEQPFDRDDRRDRFGLPLMAKQIGGPDLIQPVDQSMCFTPARK